MNMMRNFLAIPSPQPMRRGARSPFPQSVESAIPYSSAVAPGVVMGRKGELFASWRLAGVSFETSDDAALERDAESLNLLYRSLPAGAAVTCHRVRRRFTDALSDPAEPGFAREFSRRYNEKAGDCLMTTRFYATLEIPAPARVPGTFNGTAEERLKAVAQRIREFEAMASAFGRALSRLGAVRLSEYSRGAVRFSRQLELYNYLVTLAAQPVRIPAGPLWATLGNATVWFGTDSLEVEAPGSRRYACGVELKDFCQATEPGLLDSLLYPQSQGADPKCGFIETQTFRVMGRAEGLKFLKVQQGQLIAAADASGSQIAELEAAKDGLASGDFAVGEFSYGLLVVAETEAAARRGAGAAEEKLKASGLLPYRSTLALPGLFFAALPGNAEDAPRIARVTSVNFAHFSPFHALYAGKRNGNPWGEALLMMRTPSDEPFYFNFHATPPGRNARGEMALGNTVVIGTSGTGKTVFLNACAAMAQKYRTPTTPFSLVFFDKDRGAEIAIRALPKSAYFVFEAGRETGFNPFALAPTEENIQFLCDFVRLLLETTGGPLTPAELLQASQAVRAVMALPAAERRLSALAQSLVDPGARNGFGARVASTVPLRLSRWLAGGELGWVFDNAEDLVDFGSAENIGIDGTAFLESPEVCAPAAFYLLKKLEDALDGRRFAFFMDEFWKWLRDPVFSGFATNKLKTIRKQNGLGVFATQSPADIMRSPIARDVIEQTATQVFLPNPRATESDYIEGFKLTREEFELVKRLPEASRMMLVRQGGRSALARLDLAGFPEALAVLSGSSGNVRILESLIGRAPVPEVPQSAWLPKFLKLSLNKEDLKC